MEAESASIVVHLGGEIDLVTSPILADTIAAAFRQRRHVIVDLTDVGFLDASGLSVLRRAAVQHIGRFAVAVSAPRLRRLFDLARLADVIPLAASVERGLEYLTDAGRSE
jgi:anti-anti-sigma factor